MKKQLVIFTAGFTLLEMAVVLLVLSFLIGRLLAPLPEKLEQQNIRETQKQLKQIKEALLGFAILHNRLPCSASDKDGLESTSPCNSEGYLPWRNLAVEPQDTWGNFFRYRVDEKMVGEDDEFPYPFDTGSGLEVKEGTISLVDVDQDNDESQILAIVYSYGKNAEADGDNAITDEIYETGDLTPTFDDILIWLPKTIVVNRLVRAGKWPP